MVEGQESFKEHRIKMFEIWMDYAQEPWVLALLIIIGTYILEDAAIISAALISSDEVINPELAFLSLFIGIFTGDLGLYWLGKMLEKWNWLTTWINSEKVKRAGYWLEGRMTSTVLLVRIIPGLRLPVYLACGFLKLSFMRFFILTGFASLVWTGIVFYGFYWFGSLFWSELSGWKWLLLPLFVGFIILGHKKVFNEKIIISKLESD